jgi:5-(carboxyamino)imidazole ribonucleotide mutase
MTNNAATDNTKPLVAVIMGSKSDWETMQHAERVLVDFGVPHESKIVSAHRTPAWLSEFATSADRAAWKSSSRAPAARRTSPAWSRRRRRSPSSASPSSRTRSKAWTRSSPSSKCPGGVPVGTLAIGKPGAINAALLAIAILATSRPDWRDKLRKFRDEQTARVRGETLP